MRDPSQEWQNVDLSRKSGKSCDLSIDTIKNPLHSEITLTTSKKLKSQVEK